MWRVRGSAYHDGHIGMFTSLSNTVSMNRCYAWVCEGKILSVNRRTSENNPYLDCIPVEGITHEHGDS